MFTEGECVEVKNPHGPGWIAAKFGYLAEDQPPRHIDHPGINDGRGYDEPQYWVVYQEGDADGTPGLHILNEIRRREERTTPDDARRQLGGIGLPAEALSDEQAIEILGQILRAKVPAPAVPAGSPPINGRAWLAAALTAGGFRRPEDRKQTADLGDGGPPVPLGALAILVMRHLPNARPQIPWTDERLAAETNGKSDDLRRTQALLDEVAEDLDIPNKLGFHWWES